MDTEKREAHRVDTFICSCGKLFRVSRAVNEGTVVFCPACNTRYVYSRTSSKLKRIE